jgi:hypothetical protein
MIQVVAALMSSEALQIGNLSRLSMQLSAESRTTTA